MPEDWRIRIEVEEERAGGLLERLGVELDEESAELAEELKERRLAVSRDGNEIFVYAATRDEAARAGEVIDALLREEGIDATRSAIEHWLDGEERWDDEPADGSWEEEELRRGYAPWEVRIDCGSHHEARELADRLEREGRSVERRWRYLIVGAASREEAETFAAALHGTVEPGGELVWETVRGNPFAVFGGLGGAGAPT